LVQRSSISAIGVSSDRIGREAGEVLREGGAPCAERGEGAERAGQIAAVALEFDQRDVEVARRVGAGRAAALDGADAAVERQAQARAGLDEAGAVVAQAERGREAGRQDEAPARGERGEVEAGEVPERARRQLAAVEPGRQTRLVAAAADAALDLEPDRGSRNLVFR